MIEIGNAVFMVIIAINIAIISSLIYINIQNKIKNKRLFEIAFSDSITTLGNGSYFKEKGNEYLKTRSRK